MPITASIIEMAASKCFWKPGIQTSAGNDYALLRSLIGEETETMNKEQPTPGGHGKKITVVSLVRSSAAERSTFVAALYDVSIPTINKQLKRIFSDNELDES